MGKIFLPSFGPKLPKLKTAINSSFHKSPAMKSIPTPGNVMSKVKNFAKPTATTTSTFKAAPSMTPKTADFYEEEHITFSGIPVTIENRAGTERSGIGKDGKEWTTHMNFDYGFFDNVKTVDKDELDVYLGPNESAEMVFVIRQVDPDTRALDEYKVMMGFEDEESAIEAYKSQYDRPDFFGGIQSIPIDQFRDIIKEHSGGMPFIRPKLSFDKLSSDDGNGLPYRSVKTKIIKSLLDDEDGKYDPELISAVAGGALGLGLMIKDRKPYKFHSERFNDYATTVGSGVLLGGILGHVGKRISMFMKDRNKSKKKNYSIKKKFAYAPPTFEGSKKEFDNASNQTAAIKPTTQKPGQSQAQALMPDVAPPVHQPNLNVPILPKVAMKNTLVLDSGDDE